MSKSRLIGEHFRADGKPKRRFPTRAAAQKHAHRHAHDNVIIYPCTFCSGWHYATRRHR